MNVNTPSVLKILVVIAACLCLSVNASAATLQAKVVEVESGNALVVSNIKRPLRIKLKAIAPPESGQPFSEIAREHLKTLVWDKPVFVEYTHLAEGYLEAKVVLNGIDIGSQMLRDGVAWYDRASDYQLNVSDRDLYARCEQAARYEKRGLWQDQSPIAPWEFRKAQLAKLNPVTSSPSLRQSTARARTSQPGLSNADLMGAMVGPASIAGQPSFQPISANGAPGRWTRFESAAAHFSVLFPSDGVEAKFSVLDGQSKEVPFHYLIGRNDDALYLVMSTKGPNGKYTDASAADEALSGFVGAINRHIEKAGLTMRVTSRPVRNLKLNSYSGKQYSLSSEILSAVVRVFSRQVNDQRELFMLIVLDRPGSESLSGQFLDSFKTVQ